MNAAARPPLRQCWLVRAGRGARHADAFAERGFVSIGRAGIPGLRDLRDHDEDEILSLLRAFGRGQPRADLRELLDFRDAIDSRDLVVTPNTPRGELLLGIVVGPYAFSASPRVADHRHWRAVEWVEAVPRAMLDEALWRPIRSYQRTVLRLPEDRRWLTFADRR